ncbi:MAG: sulfatase-like hydrolase/transferase [Gammaproteobacteria bacterium]|nr:sulfatase-like hydrolase/transferase [Gammaproteobacteria bacterium]
MLYLSLALFATVLGLLFARKLTAGYARFQFIPLTALVVITLFYLVADYFTASGIDASVIYHLRIGLDGAGFREYVTLIGTTALLLAGWLLGFGLLVRRSGRQPVSGFNSGSILLSCMAILVNPGSHDLYQLFSPSSQTDSLARQYIEHPQVRAGEQPLNILYIYAESLEETYFDEQLFPGLLPNLQKLRQRALVFSDVSQVTHSSWTIAGMVASQCGVPLFTPGDGNSLSGMKRFMEGAICMGDLLKQQGYHLAFMGGANTAFAGKDNFYLTHGFDSVEGRLELQERLSNVTRQSAWGLYDDDLLHFAKQKLAVLHKTQQPFGLYLLTLDTHHPRGHLSDSCSGITYRQDDNPMLNAVHCTDRLLADFIRDIEQAGLTDNTLIVLGSDHLAMKNTAHAELAQGNRKNFLLMLPPGLEQGEVIDKPASVLDAGVTALSLMGLHTQGMGFGRNILEPEPTLRSASEDFNRALEASRADLGMLWSYPGLGQGLVFDEQQQEVTLEQTTYKYPLLLLLDDDHTLRQTLFDFNAESGNASYLQNAEPDQAYIWVDRCHKLAAFLQLDPVAATYCITMGRLGQDQPVLYAIEPGFLVTAEQISTLIPARVSQLELGHYGKQQALLQQLSDYGVLVGQIENMPPDFPYTALLAISAPGMYQGDSGYLYLAQGAMHQEMTLLRGLNLIGLSPRQPPERLVTYDGCALAQDDMPLPPPLERILSESAHDYYLLIAHDSVHCGEPAGLAGFLAGERLVHGKDIGYRQGYIALLDRNSLLYEAIGLPEQQLTTAFIRQQTESPSP